MDYYIVIIQTTNEVAEILSSMVFDINAKGIEFIEADNSEKTYYDQVEMKIFFSAEENIDDKLAWIENELIKLSVMTDIGEYSIRLTRLDDDLWLHNWKKYYKTFKVNDKIVIKPAWEDYNKVYPSEIVIEIDPGTVFGSGTHETTAMCIKLLDEFIDKQQLIIDVGCGTSVLGIAGVKLGALKGICVDIDKESVVVSRNNIELNGLTEKISVRHGDLIDEIAEQAELVVANILAEVILVLLKDIKRVLKKGGIFIASGIISDKEAIINKQLIQSGFEIIKTLKQGEWVAIASKYRGNDNE